MESPEDRKSQDTKKEVPMAIMQMPPNEQKLPTHANAVLADLIMQMHKPNTNMRIRQVKGQRLYGPPSNHVGPPPPKGCEVFVGKIPNNVFELELVPIFEQVGKIFEMRILMNFNDNNRGYGFVQYYTPEEADKAVSVLENFEIRPNRRLGVVKSAENRRLCISKIRPYKTGDQIFSEINRANVPGVTRIITTSGAGYGGLAFIDFEDHRAAAIALSSMVLGKTQLWGKFVHVGWAKPEPNTRMSSVRNLAEKTIGNQPEDSFHANSGNGTSRKTRMDDIADITFDTPHILNNSGYQFL